MGPGWNKKKVHSQYDDIPSGNTVQLSPIISLPILPTSSNQMDLDLPIENSFSKVKRQSLQSFLTANDDDFVRVPKVEYEAIKERVSAIESRISQEFGKVQSEMLLSENVDADNGTNLENVNLKYEQTLEGTELMNSSATDSLVIKMGKELKIRSADNKIIRSPSARKIGTMRRRSRENVRLSRNQSWHFGSKQQITTNISNNQSEHMFYPKMSLKRGRPNTVQTGLRHPSPKESFLSGLQQPEVKIDENNFADALENENWINGEQFFSSEHMQHPPVSTPTRNVKNSIEGTPRFVSHLTLGEMKTPMLPPKRSVVPRTPATIAKASVRVSQRQSFISKPQSQQQLSSVQEQQTGRASIARLRSQNAGMVAAKAKLFNGLVHEPTDLQNQKTKKPSGSSLNNRMTQDETKKHSNARRDNGRSADKANTNSRKSTPRSTPRRHRNSHGINRRLKLRNALTPNKNSPRLSKRILENELVNHTVDRDNKFNNRFASRLKIASSPESGRIRHNRTHSKSPNKQNKTKLTPVKLRSSPRLQIRNASNQELMPYL